MMALLIANSILKGKYLRSWKIDKILIYGNSKLLGGNKMLSMCRKWMTFGRNVNRYHNVFWSFHLEVEAWLIFLPFDDGVEELVLLRIGVKAVRIKVVVLSWRRFQGGLGGEKGWGVAVDRRWGLNRVWGRTSVEVTLRMGKPLCLDGYVGVYLVWQWGYQVGILAVEEVKPVELRRGLTCKVRRDGGRRHQHWTLRVKRLQLWLLLCH